MSRDVMLPTLHCWPAGWTPCSCAASRNFCISLASGGHHMAPALHPPCLLARRPEPWRHGGGPRSIWPAWHTMAVLKN